jgi:hypothetical protein
LSNAVAAAVNIECLFALHELFLAARVNIGPHNLELPTFLYLGKVIAKINQEQVSLMI